jgi:hypothetical protein
MEHKVFRRLFLTQSYGFRFLKNFPTELQIKTYDQYTRLFQFGHILYNHYSYLFKH